jgi:hypothetical protein
MKNYLRGSPKERLARLSTKNAMTGCVEFVGYLNGDGYGRFYYDGKRALSHRASFNIHCGGIPEDKQVLHHCDNPCCVNPEHLFLGTIDDNVQDMVAKGRARGVRGVRHHKAKLNPEKAFEIRWRAAYGEQHKDIAASFGVTRSLVGMIARNTIWQQDCHD